MHPAPSVIIFTALSGLGFGLLFWLGAGVLPVTGWSAFAFFFIGYGLAVGGLMASTFHLGNPQRFLRALTQWQTSWLSREGILSIAALLTMAPFAAARVFLGADWPALGILGAILSFATIGATGMIYAQLKTVPRWNHWSTPALFLAFALGGGALLAGQVIAAAALLALATALQVYAWIDGDTRFARAGSTMGTATGLGPIGSVRLLEGPHSGSNYLLKEMVHVVGRRHARQLRMIAGAALALGPVMLIALPAGHLVGGIAFALHLIGLFAARWLFFAEAEHVVGLYYGRR